MTDAELDELIGNCPTLYHMAERGSWPSIKAQGLLSTTALLDLYETPEPRRSQIEGAHRPKSIEISVPGFPKAVIRDQIPMSDNGLRKALPSRLTPQAWYRILNSKVFFWLSIDRLHRLTDARAYRDFEHDVLEIDTRSLIEAHGSRIWLCPINSGCTKPFPHARDETIFSRISDYDYARWRSKRPDKRERAVELAIDYSVPDISDHLRRVVVKRGSDVISIIA